MRIQIPIEALQLARFAGGRYDRDPREWLRIDSPTPNLMRATATDGHTLAQWEWECVEAVLVDPLYLYAPDVKANLLSVPKRNRVGGVSIHMTDGGDVYSKGKLRVSAIFWTIDEHPLPMPLALSSNIDFPPTDQVMVSRELRMGTGEMGVRLSIDVRKVVALLDWSKAVNRNGKFEMTIHEGHPRTGPVRFDTTAEPTPAKRFDRIDEPRQGEGVFLVMPCIL